MALPIVTSAPPVIQVAHPGWCEQANTTLSLSPRGGVAGMGPVCLNFFPEPLSRAGSVMIASATLPGAGPFSTLQPSSAGQGLACALANMRAQRAGSHGCVFRRGTASDFCNSVPPPASQPRKKRKAT